MRKPNCGKDRKEERDKTRKKRIQGGRIKLTDYISDFFAVITKLTNDVLIRSKYVNINTNIREIDALHCFNKFKIQFHEIHNCQGQDMQVCHNSRQTSINGFTV